jgi:hypothetical protein
MGESIDRPDAWGERRTVPRIDNAVARAPEGKSSMSQPTVPNHPRTSAAGRHLRPPGSPLQDMPIPPGIHDGFQEQSAAVPEAYGQTYPAVAYQGYPPATFGQVRSTGLAVFLFTLGIHGLVRYQVHEQMTRHSGQGHDGGLSQRRDRTVVPARHVYLDRADHLVRQDRQRAERQLAVAWRPLTH